MIKIENISKIYRPQKIKKNKASATDSTEVLALNNISTEIFNGEFTAIAGPSGSGKTTLLNLIGCLDSITAGKIFIDNQEISQLTEKEKNLLRQQKIGFIFQSYNLIPVLTAQENVELALNLLGKYTTQKIQQMAKNILEEVGLAGLENRRPNELSGGQQQRVSIARALVKRPAVILADEPTANLDSKTSLKILELMQQLNKKHGTTFVFSTHDKMVKDHCRRVIYLQDGQITSEINE